MRAVVWSSACVLLSLGACSNAARNGGPGSAGNSGGGSAGNAESTGGAGSAGSTVGQGGDAGAGAGSSGAAGVGGINGAAGGAGSATEGGVPDGAMAGAGGAGGALGAGGVGGYGFMGASRCATAGTQLCESFESDLDATLWTTTSTGDATVTVDAMHARGTKALHVKTIAGSGHAYITERRTFPATGNTLYARMFLWFEDGITTQGHFSLVEGAGTGTAAVARFGGQFQEFGVGTDHGMSGDWTDHDTVLIPSKQWICVEVEFDGAANAFHVWTDEVHRTALDSGANRHASFVMPQFTSLWFGWWMYNATEPQDLWIDEIAVDSKPIGCAK